MEEQANTVEIDGWIVPDFLCKTTKKTEATFAICKDCGHKFEKFDAPWAMTKSLGLHTYGMGHKSFLLLTLKENSNVDKVQNS